MIKSTDFRPEHFANGKSFDRSTFDRYIRASGKLTTAMWTRYLPCTLAGCAVGWLLSRNATSASGHMLALLCIFAGILLAPLSVKSITGEIKSCAASLGITRKDVAEARRHLRNGTVAWRETPEKKDTADT